MRRQGINEQDDPELLALVRAGCGGRSSENGVGRPPLDGRWIGWDGERRVDVRPPDWEAFRRLVQADPIRMGVFVPSPRVPGLRTPIHVAFHLPHGGGVLQVHADVVHVVHTGPCVGFGLAFEAPAAEVRLVLEHVSLYALQCARVGELSREIPRWLDGIRRALEARLRTSDATVLGLEPGAGPEAIREGYAKAEARWRALLGRGRLTDQVRVVLDDYGAKLREHCGRMIAFEVPLAVPVEHGARRPPCSLPQSPRTTSAAHRNPRRYLARIAVRSRPSRSSAVRSLPQPSVTARMSRVYRCISRREYQEAEAMLCDALQRDPLDGRAQTVLLFVRARKALSDRDFNAARRLYEAVLQREPGNRAARRDLQVLRALG